MADRHEAWLGGAAYEPFMGRWSRLVAREFIAWLAVPPGGRWLEVGSGPGALTQTILAQAAPQTVRGVDQSDDYVAFARDQVRDARASFEVGEAQALPMPSAAYEAVVSGLVLNFVPKPSRMAAEMARAARPGGSVALYVWDYAGQMQMLRHFWDAAAGLDPAAAQLDEGRRFPICQPERLAELWQAAGLQSVDVRAFDVPTNFRDFDDFWQPFLSGQAPAPRYARSLGEAQRAALRERLRAALPTGLDGAIRLVARAWAVRGRRPEQRPAAVLDSRKPPSL